MNFFKSCSTVIHVEYYARACQRLLGGLHRILKLRTTNTVSRQSLPRDQLLPQRTPTARTHPAVVALRPRHRRLLIGRAASAVVAGYACKKLYRAFFIHVLHK